MWKWWCNHCISLIKLRWKVQRSNFKNYSSINWREQLNLNQKVALIAMFFLEKWKKMKIIITKIKHKRIFKFSETKIMQLDYNDEDSTYISFVLLMFLSRKLTIQKSILPYWCYCHYLGQKHGKLNTKLNMR